MLTAQSSWLVGSFWPQTQVAQLADQWKQHQAVGSKKPQGAHVQLEEEDCKFWPNFFFLVAFGFTQLYFI